MNLNSNHNSQDREIKICFWNIHGRKSEIIKDKLLDPEFIKMLKNSDIIALAELHTEEKYLFIPGYKLLKQKIRKKEHKGPKISGGIAVFAKEAIFDSTHVVPNTNENSIWVKVKNRSDKKDIFIGSYYVSPENKKRKQDLFALLIEETERLRDKGDFNARIGEKNDFIEPDPFFDKYFDNPITTTSNKILPPRNSEDAESNIRGGELLDFCKTNEFAITNGRKLGDLFGKCTSHQYNGSSAIDLVLTTVNNFEKISFFEVGNYIPWLSDHSPIFSDVQLDIDTLPPEPPITLHGRDQGYLWYYE